MHISVHSSDPNFIFGIINTLVSNPRIVLFVKLDELRHPLRLRVTGTDRTHISNVHITIEWLKIDALRESSSNVDSKQRLGYPLSRFPTILTMYTLLDSCNQKTAGYCHHHYGRPSQSSVELANGERREPPQ